MELKNEFLNNKLFEAINKTQSILYIKALYNKREVKFIEKNKHIFQNKDIFLSLDFLNNQNEIQHENIFKLISILKNNGVFINYDFIRLESAYKRLYVI
jgi:hypothetical protein